MHIDPRLGRVSTRPAWVGSRRARRVSHAGRHHHYLGAQLHGHALRPGARLPSDRLLGRPVRDRGRPVRGHDVRGRGNLEGRSAGPSSPRRRRAVRDLPEPGLVRVRDSSDERIHDRPHPRGHADLRCSDRAVVRARADAWAVLARDRGLIRGRRTRRGRRWRSARGRLGRPARRRDRGDVGCVLGRDRAADAPLFALPDQRGRRRYGLDPPGSDGFAPARDPELRPRLGGVGASRLRRARPARPHQHPVVQVGRPGRALTRDPGGELPALPRGRVRGPAPEREPQLAAGARGNRDRRGDRPRPSKPCVTPRAPACAHGPGASGA